MPVSEKIPTNPAAPASPQLPEQLRPCAPNSRPPDDGTRALLQAGFWIVLGGLLSLLSTETLFGGIGIHGAHTNAGWLSLMFALMAVPFGLMLLVLGVAKWLRNRHSDRRRISQAL